MRSADHEYYLSLKSVKKVIYICTEGEHVISANNSLQKDSLFKNPEHLGGSVG